jgi:hypothetical protein
MPYNIKIKVHPAGMRYSPEKLPPKKDWNYFAGSKDDSSLPSWNSSLTYLSMCGAELYILKHSFKQHSR